MEREPGRDDDLPERFSLVSGGAFHAFLERLGLLSPEQLPTQGAAIGMALLAFSLPGLAAVLQTLLDSQYSGWDYFQDGTVYARYLVAIAVMVATERMADGRIILMIQYFRDAQLLEGSERSRFATIVSRADRQASSKSAEWLILAGAFVWSMSTTRFASVIAVDNWEGIVLEGDRIGLSWAGEVSAITSNTLFLFLVLRWFWRFYIWASLLRRTASLNLQIMPLHPDRCGGLGFLAIFPGIFSGLVFALSCVIAASFHKALPYVGESSQIVWLAIALWLVLVVLTFIGPLLVFVRPLYARREIALMEYGRLAHEHHLEFHRKWIEQGGEGEEIMGSADPSSMSDLNASVQTVNEMRVLPIDRNALLQLLASAGVPMLFMAALQMPVGELVRLILGVLL
jgi:hypothetical protein